MAQLISQTLKNLSTTLNTDHVLAKNKAYVADFKGAGLPHPPTMNLVIITCIDARIDPSAAFGLPLGGAHIIRNAGGSAREALRSLIISHHMLETNEIHIVKHVGCGMPKFTNNDAVNLVKKNLGADAAAEIAGMDFHVWPDVHSSIKDDMQFLKNSKAVPDSVKISGWLYDDNTGKVERLQ